VTKVNNKKVYFKCSEWLSERWIFVNHAISQNSVIIIMLLSKKISKDDLVLTYGVTFLEIDWTSGPFFINGTVLIYCSIIKGNNQLSGWNVILLAVLNRDGATPHNARIFKESFWWMMEGNLPIYSMAP
jgi:hypothetical protein